RTRAEDSARRIEYRWQPESTWTRSALADMRMPDIRLPEGVTWERTYSKGDTEQWEQRGHFHTAMSADEMLDSATKQITAKGWQLRTSAKGERSFFRKDREGQSWLVTWKVSNGAAQNIDTTITIRKVTG